RKTARPSRPESRASPTTIPWCGRPRSGPSRAARNASAGWHAALPSRSPTRRYARECWLTRRRLEAEAAVALADRPSFRRPRLDVPLIAPPLGKASHLVLRQLDGRRRRLLDDQVAVPLVLPDREHVLAGARDGVPLEGGGLLVEQTALRQDGLDDSDGRAARVGLLPLHH